MLSKRQRFIKNISLLNLYIFISGIFFLITNIILIKRLGPSIYGEFAFAVTFANYFILIADSGLSLYGETSISKDKQNANKIIGEIFSFNIILAVFSVILMNIISIFIINFSQVQKEMLFLISIFPLINIFNFNWAIKALEKNEILSLSYFIGRISYLAGVLFFVLNKNNYLAAIIFFLTGILLTSLMETSFIIKFTGRFRLSFNKNNFKYLVLNAMPFGILTALTLIYTSLPVLFLKFLTIDKFVGFYYITNKIVVFVFLLFNTINGAFIPIIAESVKVNDIKKQSRIVSELVRFAYTLSVPICIGGFVVSKKLIEMLFGGHSSVSTELLKIMIWSVFFVSVSTVFIGYLAALNDRKSLIIPAFMTALSGSIISFLLIKYYGIYGGAVSNLIIEIIMFIGLISSVATRIRISFDIINFIKVAAASVIMGYLIRLFDFGIFLTIITGIILYFILLIVFKIFKKEDMEDLKAVLFRNA